VSKHRFIIVVPVADRPRHIQACLGSLRELLRRFPHPHPVRVLIADDSADAAHIDANRRIADEFSRDGIAAIHFGPDAQWALSEKLRATLPGVVGDKPRDAFGHKGQGVMRNIAWLKVAEMLRGEPDADNVLIWSLDSDQEFRVNVEEDDGYVVDYFGGLDAIFSHTDAQVLTGKVVGDPPVSPAVMTANFLTDIEGFLQGMATVTPQAPCSHHGTTPQAGDAAYHDMADLFGFRPAERYAYPCPLIDAHGGAHSEADCFAHFAGRVNSFFYGEHPTRVSRYAPAELFATIQPARTVYAGNYVFRPQALKYFIPFANLRLRMSGPTLGRILKAELGERFVSANLPMLHKRTVESGGQAEFRPGIATVEAAIDMSGEFERQFYGDVMLFATERRPTGADFLLLDTVREEMLAKYNARQQAILNRLGLIETLLNDPARWWHTLPAAQRFRHFCANVRRNFGTDSSGQALINDPARWMRWRGDLAAAVARYPTERTAWEQALCAA
jgi:hypothetical protein